jgi:hypothetical protein
MTSFMSVILLRAIWMLSEISMISAGGGPSAKTQ